MLVWTCATPYSNTHNTFNVLYVFKPFRYTKNVKYIRYIEYVDGEGLIVQKKKKVARRNVVLKIHTYERLEKYKVELVNKREDPKVTFDDAINSLLDEHKQARGSQH